MSDIWQTITVFVLTLGLPAWIYYRWYPIFRKEKVWPSTSFVTSIIAGLGLNAGVFHLSPAEWTTILGVLGGGIGAWFTGLRNATPLYRINASTRTNIGRFVLAVLAAIGAFVTRDPWIFWVTVGVVAALAWFGYLVWGRLQHLTDGTFFHEHVGHYKSWLAKHGSGVTSVVIATVMSGYNAYTHLPPFTAPPTVAPIVAPTGYVPAADSYHLQTFEERSELRAEDYRQINELHDNALAGMVLIPCPENGGAAIGNFKEDPGHNRGFLYQSSVELDIAARIARYAQARGAKVEWPIKGTHGELNFLPLYWDPADPPTAVNYLKPKIKEPLKNAATDDEKVISCIAQFVNGWVVSEGREHVVFILVSFASGDTASGGVKIYPYVGEQSPLLSGLTTSLHAFQIERMWRILEPRFNSALNKFVIEYGNLNYDKDYIDIQNPIVRERLARDTVNGLLPSASAVTH